MIVNRKYYLEELILKNNSLEKVITGIRRCEKFFLLNKLFYEYLLDEGVLEDHIIKIALDDLENKPLLDANKLNEYMRSKIKDTEQYYLFMHEIQEVDHFFHY